MEQPKVCSVCKKSKPPGAFDVCKTMRGGRRSKCKECNKRIRAKASRMLIDDPAVFRDERIVLLAASVDRWRHTDDREERDSARQTVLLRAAQLLEAERLCGE